MTSAAGRRVFLALALAANLISSPAVAAGAATGTPAQIMAGLAWGESSDALKRHFGKAAIDLAPPIEFGDAYVDVALRDVTLGGYAYVVYFQMDKTSHSLRRVMYERQRHGANRAVFGAAVRAIEAELGTPARCTAKGRPANGYQASDDYRWRDDSFSVRAIFRDTTLEAENGCQTIGFLPCGLEGHLFITIDPPGIDAPPCQ